MGHIEKARSWLGLKGYLTDIPEAMLDGAGEMGLHHDLFQMQASFRMAKINLRAWPIFTSIEDSVHAHLTVFFPAPAIGNHRQQATGLGILRIVLALRPLRDVAIAVNRTPARETQVSRVTLNRHDPGPWADESRGARP